MAGLRGLLYAPVHPERWTEWLQKAEGSEPTTNTLRWDFPRPAGVGPRVLATAPQALPLPYPGNAASAEGKTIGR